MEDRQLSTDARPRVAPTLPAAEAWAGWVLRRLPPKVRVLKVGGGNGRFERQALARGVDLHCLHTRCDVAEMLRDEFGLGPRMRGGDARTLPWPNITFDVVVVADLLQHLDDAAVETLLCEIQRVLRTGGFCLGVVPAASGTPQPCPDCGALCTQTFSARDLTERLARHFAPIRTSVRQFIPWGRLGWKDIGRACVNRAGFLCGLTACDAHIAFEAALPLKVQRTAHRVRPERVTRLPLVLPEPHACLEQVRLPRSRQRPVIAHDELAPVWS